MTKKGRRPRSEGEKLHRRRVARGVASSDEETRCHYLTGCDPSTIVEGVCSQRDLINEKCRIYWRSKVGTASDADKKRHQTLTVVATRPQLRKRHPRSKSRERRKTICATVSNIQVLLHTKKGDTSNSLVETRPPS